MSVLDNLHFEHPNIVNLARLHGLSFENNRMVIFIIQFRYL